MEMLKFKSKDYNHNKVQNNVKECEIETSSLTSVKTLT